MHHITSSIVYTIYMYMYYYYYGYFTVVALRIFRLSVSLEFILFYLIFQFHSIFECQFQCQKRRSKFYK